MRKSKIVKLKGPTLVCPHCDSRAEIRTSRPIAPLTRDLYYRCTNDSCGHSFVAQLVIKHSIVASRTPRVGLILAIFPPVALPSPANDDTTLGHYGMPANDIEPPAETIMTTPG